MPQGYQVEQVFLLDGKPDLLRIWRDNLPIAYDEERRFRWMYLDAPNNPQHLFLLSYQGDNRSEKVGTASVGVRKFYFENRQIVAGILADLAVDRKHRTLMPALKLVKEVRNYALEHFDFTFGFPNKLSVGVLIRCGHEQLGVMTRFASVLRHAGYIERFIHSRLLARIGGVLPDLWKLLRRGARVLPSLGSYHWEWGQTIDSSFDSLWTDARGDYPLLAVRDAGFLRWRFLTHPSRRFEIFKLSRRADAKPLIGYAVVERQDTVAHIRDVFSPAVDRGILLELLLLSLYRRGFTSASFRFLGSQQVVDSLLTHGFEKRESEQAVIFSRGRTCPPSIKESNSGQWYLTDADLDV